MKLLVNFSLNLVELFKMDESCALISSEDEDKEGIGISLEGLDAMALAISCLSTPPPEMDELELAIFVLRLLILSFTVPAVAWVLAVAALVKTFKEPLLVVDSAPMFSKFSVSGLY